MSRLPSMRDFRFLMGGKASPIKECDDNLFYFDARCGKAHLLHFESAAEEWKNSKILQEEKKNMKK